jgi:hypothetical protein
MLNNNTPINWLWTLVLAVLLTASAWSVEAPENESQRSIKIMAQVLNKLVQSGSSNMFSHNNSRGVYIEGYGAIFYLGYSLSSDLQAERILRVGKRVKMKDGMLTIPENVDVLPSDSTASRHERQRLDQLKKEIIHFYADYAYSLRELELHETATVVVDFTDSPFAFVGRDNETGPTQLVATIDKEKLQQLHQNPDAGHLVEFYEKNGKKDGDKELEILSDIIEETISENSRLHEFFNMGSFNMYLPGLGAVLVLRTNGSFAPIEPIAPVEVEEEEIDDPEEKPNKPLRLSTGVAVNWQRQNKKDIEQKTRQLQNEIVEIIAQFGGSVRSLKNNESIWICSNSQDEGFIDQAAGGFIMKFSKTDIERYNTKQLTMEAFKNAVVIKEF